MKKLFIDIETYSNTDLIKTNLKKYIEDPDFEVMLVAYSFDQGPVELIDLKEPYNSSYKDVYEKLEAKVLIKWLEDPDIIKVAHNSNFEINCLCKYFNLEFHPEQWECTMIMARALNLPNSLKQVSEILRLKGKMEDGKALIKYFCCPCKETKVNGGRTRNMPWHAPDKWDTFKAYCIQDVEAEIGVYNKLSWIWNKLPQSEKNLWYLDQKINRKGIRIDKDFCEKAVEYDNNFKDYIKERIKMMTGLDNPNSLPQLKDWIRSQDPNVECSSITKDTADEIISNTTSPWVKQVLEVRKMLGKTSTAKYSRALSIEHKDYVHFLFSFIAANTGRFTGDKIQPQNLPKMKWSEEEYLKIRNGYKRGVVNPKNNEIPHELSQLIRTMFIPDPGYKFYIVDYSAIEARVVAWLAGQKWVLDVFRGDGRIYEATASRMFNVHIDNVTKDQRANGKTGVLACGYQGSVGAIKKFMKDIEDEKAQEIVDQWRSANPRIVELWEKIGTMVEAVLTESKTCVYRIPNESEAEIKIYKAKGFLVIKLPSGREIYYPKARIDVGRKGFNSIIYETQNQTTKRWEDTETYGGKLVENITQAIARDILAMAMLMLDKHGYDIRLHIHDELVIQGHISSTNLKEIARIMCLNYDWNKTLPLEAHGFITDHYRKE